MKWVTINAKKICTARLSLKLQPKQNSKPFYSHCIAMFLLAMLSILVFTAVLPNISTYYYACGLAFSKLDDKEKLIKNFNQAIKLNPKNATIFIYRGNALSDLGDYKDAIKDYNQAIKINHKYVDAYINRGIAQYDLGDYKSAIKDYNQAIKLNPKYLDAYINRGIAQSDLGDIKSAWQAGILARIIYWSKTRVLKGFIPGTLIT